MSQLRKTEFLVDSEFGNSRFIIGKYIARGTYGSFHLGFDNKTKQQVAIKLESKDAQQQLFLEFGFYQILYSANIRFIPKMLFFGRCTPEWNALALELLGPPLSKMADICGGTFSLVTTTQIMIQLLNIFEYVHDHGIIYRDVKPENFLIGQPNTIKWCTVCMIDLGICKQYLVKGNRNRHMQFQNSKCFYGTGRYASVNNHQFQELSRRDDLEAILYMMLFLHKGRLPWQGVPAVNNFDKLQEVGQFKKCISAARLCAKVPLEYEHYLTTVKALQFTQRPPYRKLMAQFRGVLTRLGTSMADRVYDWDESHKPRVTKSDEMLAKDMEQLKARLPPN